jgi:hypothetical protein
MRVTRWAASARPIRVARRPAFTLRDVAPQGDRFGTERPEFGVVPHAGRMAHGTASPAPGSMTVPPLYGWEAILVGLLLLIAVAVAFLVVAAARAGTSGRPEWQELLDARSRRHHDPAADPGDGVG